MQKERKGKTEGNKKKDRSRRTTRRKKKRKEEDEEERRRRRRRRGGGGGGGSREEKKKKKKRRRRRANVLHLFSKKQDARKHTLFYTLSQKTLPPYRSFLPTQQALTVSPFLSWGALITHISPLTTTTTMTTTMIIQPQTCEPHNDIHTSAHSFASVHTVYVAASPSSSPYGPEQPGARSHFIVPVFKALE